MEPQPGMDGKCACNNQYGNNNEMFHGHYLSAEPEDIQ